MNNNDERSSETMNEWPDELKAVNRSLSAAMVLVLFVVHVKENLIIYKPVKDNKIVFIAIETKSWEERNRLSDCILPFSTNFRSLF